MVTQQTKLEVDKSRGIGDLSPVMQIHCLRCDSHFMWATEDADANALPMPSFCPICGRRAVTEIKP